MPSIEFWFLLHYLNTNRYFATANDVIDVLHKYIPDFSKQEKFLSKEKWVADLLADHRLETAIQRAQAFGTESIQRAGDGFAAIVCHAKVERIELLEES